MARYEQCIWINLNRQNQNYTTINGVRNFGDRKAGIKLRIDRDIK